MAKRFGTRDPELEDVIRQAIRASRLETNTVLPGTVATFDPATRTASVQPGLDIVFDDGSVEGSAQTRAIVTGVPVVFPGTRLASWEFPLVTGDEGLLVVSQRSIDRWRRTGGTTDPKDERLHALSDGFFIPCALSIPAMAAAGPGDPTAAVVRAPTVKLGSLAAISPVAKGTELLAAVDAAIAAAIAAAAAIVPPAGDGGTAAFLAFQTAWNSAKAAILSPKVTSD